MTDINIIRLIIVGCIVVPLFITLALTPVSMRMAGYIGAIDIPKDGRRIHDRPVPCFGGMAIFVGVMAALILIRQGFLQQLFRFESHGGIPSNAIAGLMIGGAVIFAIGVVDDVRGMRPVVKLALQATAAAAAFVFGVRMDTIKMLGINFAGGSAESLTLSFIITVIWIVAIINMINLIDGMDGLAAGVVGISALAIAFSCYLHGQYDVTLGMCVVAGSSFGFLPFNFYPAKSFMGDGGSMFLGFMMAALSAMNQAKGATIVAIIVPVIVLGLPLFDVVFAVFRRAVRGQSIFKADKGHLHHQLLNIGMGQRRTVVMLYGITSIMGVAAILLSRGGLVLESIFLVAIAVLFIIVLIWKWNTNKKT